MPKAKPTLSMTGDLSSLYKADKKSALHKALYSGILPFDDEPNPSPILSQSEDASQMATASKTPKAGKTPEQVATEKFNLAVKKAIDFAKGQINAELLRTVLKDRVRNALAAEYGPGMPVAELEKQAAQAARQVHYELRDMNVLPEGIKDQPISHLGVDAKHFTAEPKDMISFDDDDD